MPSGRVRQFDSDEAPGSGAGGVLARGYEGATLPELTKAMGINRPSLYAAFGNKEQLFHKALDRYQTGPQSFVNEAFKKPTLAVAEAIFSGFVRMQRDRSRSRGCMIVSGCSRAARRRSRSVGSWPARGRRRSRRCGSGSIGPCGRATCRGGPTARHLRGTSPRS